MHFFIKYSVKPTRLFTTPLLYYLRPFPIIRTVNVTFKSLLPVKKKKTGFPQAQDVAVVGQVFV